MRAGNVAEAEVAVSASMGKRQATTIISEMALYRELRIILRDDARR